MSVIKRHVYYKSVKFFEIIAVTFVRIVDKIGASSKQKVQKNDLKLFYRLFIFC
jgi:hypothetical protein